MAKVRMSALALVLTACLALPSCQSATSTPPPPAPTFTVLYSFTGGADGANPTTATMVRDAQGNLYGTTQHGGDNICNASTHPGCGTVFRLDAAGNLTVLHTFSGAALDAGASSGLVLDGNGNLYGTADDGIANGLVFEIAKNGTYTVLYDFTGGSDGDFSTGNLVQDAAGNLYGTSLFGGGSNDPSCGGPGCGTVFELGPTGQLKVLYSFLDNADGTQPYSVIRDSAGNLFGATYHGGQGCVGVLGCGTIFKVDASGQKTVLYAFTGGTDGSTPSGSLVMDSASNLYGTTSAGGDLACPYNGGAGCGVVFKLDTQGVETVLHAFHGGSDGNVPVSVILGADGNLYGTTQSGPNTSICGTVFKLDTLGNLTNLHNITGGAEGCGSVGALVRDAAGNLYGATVLGGDEQNIEICLNGCGTVFKIKP
jgi:uncharacterized repeat protein (TIGR03803 family)